MKPLTTIYVVDDDARVLKALVHLFRASGFTVHAFESAPLFLRQYDPAIASCVICDLAMPRYDGLRLQRELAARGGHSPVIFLSGHGSVRGSVQAMKQGAVDFLTKPVKPTLLLAAVQRAIERDAATRDAHSRIDSLTEREREVLRLIAGGQLNKQVADSCGVTLRTAKFHRANLVRKLGVNSVAEMMTLVIRSGLIRIHPTTASGAAKPGRQTS